MCPKVDQKPKEQGKRTTQFQDICEIGFKNKRVGHILSRMIGNKQKRRESPIQMITVKIRGPPKTQMKIVKRIMTFNMTLFQIYLPSKL
jgi:hypothetical protein